MKESRLPMFENFVGEAIDKDKKKAIEEFKRSWKKIKKERDWADKHLDGGEHGQAMYDAEVNEMDLVGVLIKKLDSTNIKEIKNLYGIDFRNEYETIYDMFDENTGEYVEPEKPEEPQKDQKVFVRKNTDDWKYTISANTGYSVVEMENFYNHRF